MTFSVKFARKQLERLKPFVTESKIESARRGQEIFGEFLSMTCKKTLEFSSCIFENFESVWAIPKDEIENGIMLYLHGGGYCCGDIAYAKGVAAMLASRFGVRVFAPAYRLAPQYPFPTPILDCLTAYEYLLTHGYEGNQIILC
jgi:acetyl esterase/lipase